MNDINELRNGGRQIIAGLDIGTSKIGAVIGIQNYLPYKNGKKPVKKPMEMEDFRTYIAKLEKKYDKDLTFLENETPIVKDNEIPRAFQKNEVIEAQIVWDGRLKGTKIAVSRGHVVNISKTNKTGRIKAKITRNKHGIYWAVQV